MLDDSFRFSGKVLVLVPSVLLAFFAACSVPPATVHYDRAVEAFEQGRLKEAYGHSQAALTESPDDRKVQRFAERMRTVALLDEARARVISGKEYEGLSLLARVLTNHPENSVALLWQQKAKDQIAMRMLLRGQEAVADSEPERALESFQEVLGLRPGDEVALRGLKEVRAIYDMRREFADDHDRSALLARRDGDWERVLYHADATLESDPAHERATYFAGVAARQVARKRRAWADQLAAERRFAAAGREMLEVVALLDKLRNVENDPVAAASDDLFQWIPEGQRIAKTWLDEAAAAEAMTDAQLAIAGKRFDQATEALDRAAALSTYELVAINDLRGQILDARRDERYSEAQFFELGYDYKEALEVYRALAKDDPAGSATQKVETLTQLFVDVEKAYDEGRIAERNGKTDEAMSAYRRVLSLHPRYEDAAKRLAALAAAALAAGSADR